MARQRDAVLHDAQSAAARRVARAQIGGQHLRLKIEDGLDRQPFERRDIAGGDAGAVEELRGNGGSGVGLHDAAGGTAHHPGAVKQPLRGAVQRTAPRR